MYDEFCIKTQVAKLYTTVFYTSADDGITWVYASRVDVTKDMTKPGEGPCEPSSKMNSSIISSKSHYQNHIIKMSQAVR